MRGPAMSSPDDLLRNRLGRAIGHDERERISGDLTYEVLRTGDVLSTAGAEITHVHLPLSGIISEMTILEDGSAAEVTAVGNEGLVNAIAFLGYFSSGNTRAVVQMRVEVLSMPAHVFYKHSHVPGALHDAMQRHLAYVFVRERQAIACNRLHTIEQRCARWLLMTHDRAGSDAFPLTQDFLADVLGTYRPSVTNAAGALQEQGAITYRRGTMTIADRAKLLESSCECYRAVQDELERSFSSGA
jgi:CRP-like cAMP-binding protein